MLVRQRQRHRPHPRSLDALFPRPVPKRCARGHTQTPHWKPQHGCSTCDKQAAAMAEAERLARLVAERLLDEPDPCAAERDHWRRVLPQLPDPYVLRDFHGRVVQVYRAGGRRGPKRRRRI